MAESEAMQSIVNQAAVQGATAGMPALRDANTGPRLAAKTTSPREHYRQKTWWIGLRKALI